MSQKQDSVFEKIKGMVRNHLADAEKRHTGHSGENPGPTPDQCYTAALSTATGAYGARGITVAQWSNLHAEVRSHKDAFQGQK